LISVGPSSASGTGTGTGTGFSSDSGAVSTGLSVRAEVTSQQVGGTSGDSFKIPAGVFGHTDPKAVVTIQATLEDGSPLPSWLKFDAGTGTFTGKPPEGEKQELQIKVTARDTAGSEATVNFKLDVNENGNQPAGEGQDGQNNSGQQRTDAGRPADRQSTQAALLGRPSLTAQLKAASGQNGFMAEGLALLESLLKAAGIEDTDKAA
jgi:Putative Ig domain